jgi:deoxyuridine 5'-triphosphate nucleotidohydrolase
VRHANDLCLVCCGGVDGRIAPRSGLASKHFIDTGAGVIDADYRGQVRVLLFNHGEVEYMVKEGERVAQLVLERVGCPQFCWRGMWREVLRLGWRNDADEDFCVVDLYAGSR